MSDELTSIYSYSQRKALSIAPHITGLLSFLGSAFIVLEIARDKTKHGQIYHRIMLGISTITLFASVFLGLSTWPIPRGTENVFDARGNERTCTAQGFFIALSLIAPMYNVALAGYYLMVIGYGRKERHLRILERWSHAIVISIGLAFAFAGLGLNLYHSVQLWCFIGPISCDGQDPQDCSPDSNNFQLFRWLFFGIPVWMCIFLITGLMVGVFYKVRSQEIVSRKWRQGTEGKGKELSKRVATQAAWYVSSFYITWTFPTISRAMTAFGHAPPFWLVLLSTMLLPLQGAFNFAIYIRPRYVKYRKNNPDKCMATLMMETFLRTCRVWRCRDEEEDSVDDDMNLALRVGDLYQTTAAALSSVVSGVQRQSVTASQVVDVAVSEADDK